MNIFDGKKLVASKEIELRKKVEALHEFDIIPKLVSIVVGDEDGAIGYQQMKKRAAERVGCQLVIVSYQSSIDLDELLNKIDELNNDKLVHGVMLQLPLPERFETRDRERLINAIDPSKDVDGMRDDSPFIAPVVLAVLEALHASDLGFKNYNLSKKQIVVVGANGFVGRKITNELRFKNYDLQEVEVGDDLDSKLKDADVIISATGKAGLITSNMIKDGIVLIDVGAPKGDFAEGSYAKASFYTPVPGGIGPMTIYFLVENLVMPLYGKN